MSDTIVHVLREATPAVIWFPQSSNIPHLALHSTELYESSTMHDSQQKLTLYPTDSEFSFVGFREFDCTGLSSYGVFSTLGMQFSELREPRYGFLGDKKLELLSWGASRPSYVNKFLPAGKQVVDVSVQRTLNGSRFSGAYLSRALGVNGLRFVSEKLLQDNIHILLATFRNGGGATIVPSIASDRISFPPECYASKASDMENKMLRVVGNVVNFSDEQLASILAKPETL